MTNAILFSLLLAGSAASATELTVQPLSAQSRYIEIPAQGGPVWQFEREGERVKVTRDSQGAGVYHITILQLSKSGERRELSNQVFLSPGPAKVIGGVSDSQRGMTVYLVSLAATFDEEGGTTP